MRPTIITLLMLAIFFATLEGTRSGNTRRLFFLPLAQVVWANCQGLSAFGPALVASYLLAAFLSPRAPSSRFPDRLRFWATEGALPRRALAVTFCLCVAALFITPYGLRGAALPGRLLLRLAPVGTNVFSANVAENVPPLILWQTAPQQVAHFPWYLAALAVCVIVARRQLCLSRLLVLLGFTGLALMANRNVVLLYWLATPIAATVVAPVVGPPLERWWRGGGWFRVAVVPRAALAFILGGELALAWAAHEAESPVADPAPFHFPVSSARVLKECGAAGSVFAPDHHGGYLTFMVPGLTPYIDTRLTLHTGLEYAAYLQAVDQPARFDALDATVHFRYVVLTTGYPDRYLALAQHLAASPAWRLSATDGAEV
ncbi:MAG: hypothetical protein ABUS79_06130, partial [Pseudomonadota bacterium]